MQRHLWAGSTHNLPCHLVDVLTESCQSSKGTFYLFTYTVHCCHHCRRRCCCCCCCHHLRSCQGWRRQRRKRRLLPRRRHVWRMLWRSPVRISLQRRMEKKKKTNTLIARQHKFAHSARHASPFATAEPQCSNTVATTTTKNKATHKSRHR